GAVRDRRKAVHDQRAPRAAGGDRGDQSKERDAAAGAHVAERAAEEHVPGAGRLDQGHGSCQGDPRRSRSSGQSERAAVAERDGESRAVRDGEEVGREDAAGGGRGDAVTAVGEAVRPAMGDGRWAVTASLAHRPPPTSYFPIARSTAPRTSPITS